MKKFSDKYTRLVAQKDVVIASATLDLEGIVEYLSKKLTSVEAWLDENGSLLGEAVMQDEGST